MNYRPFIGLVASIFLLNAMVPGRAATFAQSAPSSDQEPQAENICLAATGASRLAVPPLQSATLNTLADPAIDLPEARSFLAGATKADGLIPLYRKGAQVYASLGSRDLDVDFILLISIARGIAQRPLVGGHTWQFGNDWVCQFRRVENHIHFVRRNVRYRADAGSPAAGAVQRAYSDSILFSMPILAAQGEQQLVVDLTPVFMGDLPGIGRELDGFEFAADRSSWASVRGYTNNLELQVAATFTSDGKTDIETVADSRSLTVHVHYSLSKLPNSDYRPRMADDRIGYFLTVAKDYSRPGDQDKFVRYINRWHLRPEDPSQSLSPPREPLVFWLEKTIPYQYREPIREGILEWNKAFEKIGIRDAIEVRQQPDEAAWEPGDVRYNTFRWITSGIGVAAGPSRVNPHTGQILDADITFDADFLQIWKRKYETWSPESIAAMTGGPIDLQSYRRAQLARSARSHPARLNSACCYLHSFSHSLALSATVMARRRYAPEELAELTRQAVKKVAMHEVGHTLGLRHNFKGSTLYTVAQIQELSLGKGDVSLSASVMDYLPANLAAPARPQGCYYSSTIGPYDYWAIDYGYRPLPSCASTREEAAALKKIASRSGEPGHAFATDEDTRGIDADPHSGLFDNGSDLLEFAESQADLVALSWPGLVERVTEEGEGYHHARQAFGVLMITHGRAMFAASRYVGGIYSSRSHRADRGAGVPQVVVPAAVQRRALDLLSRRMFSNEAFNLPPDLYRQLAVTRWNHWGSEMPERTDFPVHASILQWQDRVLEKLLSPLTLTRLHDSEQQIAADEDAFTVVELLARLTADIFAETALQDGKSYTVRQPAISSRRRSLQSAYLDRVAQLAEGQPDAPADCQSVALLELTRLQRRIEDLLHRDVRLDRYSLAHLTATTSRISSLLDKRLAANR